MAYKELVRLVFNKILELNSENIEVTMNNEQFTCWFVDGPNIQDSIDIHVNENNTYEIYYWNKYDYRTAITTDEMFEMIVIKGDN